MGLSALEELNVPFVEFWRSSNFSVNSGDIGSQHACHKRNPFNKIFGAGIICIPIKITKFEEQKHMFIIYTTMQDRTIV